MARAGVAASARASRSNRNKASLHRVDGWDYTAAARGGVSGFPPGQAQEALRRPEMFPQAHAMSLRAFRMGAMRTHRASPSQASFRYVFPAAPAVTPAKVAAHFSGKSIQTVISGGEAGVDRAAQDAARARGYKSGGACQRGRRALNVRDADATLIVFSGALDKGTRLTEEAALRMGKPVMAIDLADRSGFDQARAWLAQTSPRVLNVAGPRESRNVGVYARSFALLVRLLGPAPQSRVDMQRTQLQSSLPQVA